MEKDFAWFAGFWDGEGSIGLTKNKSTYILSVQCSHTDKTTVEHVFKLLKQWEINGRGYTYQEKKPDKHRPSYHIRVSGIGNILKLAKLVAPHAITKKRNWEIAIKWAETRIAVSGGIDGKGHLQRGGKKDRSYSEEDHATYLELRSINGRGPRQSDSTTFGRINFE